MKLPHYIPQTYYIISDNLLFLDFVHHLRLQTNKKTEKITKKVQKNETVSVSHTASSKSYSVKLLYYIC
jgi:uncharacterized protein YgiM (DUF1202 family)